MSTTPTPMETFLDQKPQPGDTFTDRRGRAWFVVDINGLMLINDTGCAFKPSLVCGSFGPLTRGNKAPEQLLTLAEMEKAVNDPDHERYLSDERLRFVVNCVIIAAPEATAAAMVLAQTGLWA